MCKTESFTFTECEHRLPAGEIEPCGPVRLGQQIQCDPTLEEEIPMGTKCHECLEQAQEQKQHQQQADEEAELERILAGSNQTFEEEQSRPLRPSEQEEADFERALRESAHTIQPQHSEWKDDEDELAKALAASAGTIQPEHHDWMDDVNELAKAMEASKLQHEEMANKPKNYLRQKLRYACGHEVDAGQTDIEFDPMADGLPYLQIDERGQCPTCGGSSSRTMGSRTAAVPPPILGYSEPVPMTASAARRGIDEEFSGFDDEDLFDLDPLGRGKGRRGPDPSRTPPPDWCPANEYTGARPNDPYATTSLPPADGPPQYSEHPSPEALREQPLNAFQPQRATPAAPGQADRGEVSDTESEPPEMPPYATVDNLALEHLVGEQREAAERAERNKVERLRLLGALARQDAGDMSDPIAKQDP